MAELLFEIFSEEIPARMQARAGDDLVRLMDAALKDAGLSPTDSRALTGPRRLTYVTDVDTRSPDVSEERKGPRVGSPERALEGFMRGAGLSDISQAETRRDKKGEFYVAVIKKDGQNTSDILRQAIPDVMARFPWPKSMKSADTDFRWVRPLRGLTVLLNGKSLDGIEVGGIASDALVHGHRQMGPGPFEVSTLAEYEAALNGDGHVVTDRAVRRQRVLEQAQAVCAKAGLSLVEDAGLLDEVAGLVEWPVALLGDMDESFLALPEDVIRLTLKSHQKTFTVRGSDGKLAPHFVIMANLETSDGGQTIKAGNAKVISARLEDAKFFQDQDRQKPLADYYDQLDEVVFHKKLGSVRDKAERVAALAREISPHVGADPDVAERAARLAKCDLVTQSVIEFTSLQGKIGRWMYEADVALGRADTPNHAAHPDESRDPADAEASDLDPGLRRGERSFGKSDHHDIAVAIEEHYKPQGPSDAVPTNPVAVAVALADKIDTLVGFWAIDEKPTGSKDPFALRRAALGIVRSVICIGEHLPFNDLFNFALLELAYSLASNRKLFYRVDNDDRFFQVKQPNVGWREMPDLPMEKSDFFAIFEGKTAIFRDHFEGGDGPYGIAADIYFPDINDPGFDVLAFQLDRLRVYLRDQGHRHDVIDAVISQGGDDLLAISQRVEALGAFLTAGGEDLIQGYKRAANILRAEAKKSPDPVISAERSEEPGPDGGENAGGDAQTLGPGSAASGLVRDDSYSAVEARDLAAALKQADPAIDTALTSADYPAALSALAGLREPIDAFFEAVVVNSDDADERARRLALLSAIVETFHRIADFSKLDG